MIPILPSSTHPADRPVRLPVPHALRKALPSSDRAEAALAQALGGVGIPALDVSRVAGALAGSTGHAILAAPSCWTDAQLRWAYVVILHHLGDLNGRYGKLFDVADRGLDHTTSNAPVSKTKAAAGMHTDSTRQMRRRVQSGLGRPALLASRRLGRTLASRRCPGPL